MRAIQVQSFANVYSTYPSDHTDCDYNAIVVGGYPGVVWNLTPALERDVSLGNGHCGVQM